MTVNLLTSSLRWTLAGSASVPSRLDSHQRILWRNDVPVELGGPGD